MPGVGISDFIEELEEGTQSTLDRRRFVIYNEVFAYLDIKPEVIQQYIDQLLTGNGNPILREINIDDDEFLS